MNTIKKWLFAVGCCLNCLCSVAQNDLKLWYKQPAINWTEALPVGNGRLGAMVFGKIDDELIQLNESTLWSGGPVKDSINPSSPSYLKKVREELLQNENYEKASELTKKMQGVFSESFLPLGDLHIRQIFKNKVHSSYYRDLDISNAISTTKFTIDHIEFTREVFASFPDQVIMVRMSSSKPGQLNFLADLESLLHYIKIVRGNDLVMQGKAPAHVEPAYIEKKEDTVIYNDATGCNGMRFELRLKAIAKDGIIATDSLGIHITNASEVFLYLSAATSYNGFDKCPDLQGKDEDRIALRYMNKASQKTYPAILKAHVEDHQKYFNRFSLEIKDTSLNNNSSFPSDERLKRYSQGNYDPALETLYFQYGRYLLISSSRPGGVPANLQGLWNKELRAPWSSNYTININTQMNYWPAEVTNLSEMQEPLFDFIRELAVTGEITATQFYDMKGWVAHHNSDIWALSNPVGNRGGGDPKWANWTQGGNWLCLHLWEHYQFTGDKIFLEKFAYPLMKGAVRFSLDWLIEDKNGYLVTAPSVSPENSFKNSNETGDVSVATTMDMSIIRELFTNMISASEILNIDKPLREELIKKKEKLYTFHIGKKGNLQEWNKDWEDVEIQHRHVSHLFGLHPGTQISPIFTPDLAEAAKKTLEVRGDVGTGWSKAWKINFWARLLDGNHAHKLIRELLTYVSESEVTRYEGGGTYPNFFDAHPPFQIDGNFGAVAGMAEMLVQSQWNEIHLLPALPDVWKEGSVKGLKARGGYELNINWANHQLKLATLKAAKQGKCVIRINIPVTVKNTPFTLKKTDNGYLINFSVERGKIYQVIPAT